MDGDIRLVPLEQRHIEQMSGIEKECFSTPWSRELLEGELSNPLAVYLVAETADGTVAGYAGIMVILSDAELVNVAVTKERREKGIATKLLEELIDYCRDSDIEQIHLEVRRSNAPAIALYDKLGFKANGMRFGYYESPKEDALLMSKNL